MLVNAELLLTFQHYNPTQRGGLTTREDPGKLALPTFGLNLLQTCSSLCSLQLEVVPCFPDKAESSANTPYQWTLRSLPRYCLRLSSASQNYAAGKHGAFAFNVFVLEENRTQAHCSERRGLGACADHCQPGPANLVQNNRQSLWHTQRSVPQSSAHSMQYQHSTGETFTQAKTKALRDTIFSSKNT